MSWLGGGLSSFTDQITNFTKEVLTEGREEVSDHVTELNIASRRIQELEVQCTTYRQEIERIRRRNSELEERCQATELQVNSVSSQYRSLLQQKEDELQALKQKHHDLLDQTTDVPPTSPTSGSTLFRYHGDDEADLGDLITSQLEINRLATEVRKLRAERDRSGAVPKQTDNEQNGDEKELLLARIKELEKSLQEATDLNHRQVVALQDHYEQRLADVQQVQQAQINGLQKQLQLYQQGSLENSPDDELERLRSHVEETEKRLEEEQAKTKELKTEQREREKMLQLLTRQIDKLQAEKMQLNKELQSSVMKLEELQKRDRFKLDTNNGNIPERKLASGSTATISDGVQGNADEQTTTTEVIQEIQDTRTKLSAGAANIQNQLLQERQDIVEHMLRTEKQKTELKSWLGMLEAEKSRLSNEIKTLIQTLGKDELLRYVNALEEENTVLKSHSKEIETQLPETDRISPHRPEPLGESSSDSPVHSLCMSQTNVYSPNSDDGDGMASEILPKDKELNEQVKVLQLQVETYEQEVEHLRWLLTEKTQSDSLESLEKDGNLQNNIEIKNVETFGSFGEQIDELTKENTQLKSSSELLKNENESLQETSTLKELNDNFQAKLQENDSGSHDSKKSISEEKELQIHELMEEKLSLEISLEELDAQHQEAMEKILLVKNDLVETNKQLSKELLDLKEQLKSQNEQINFLKMESETVQEQFLALAKKSQQETVCTSSAASAEESPPMKSILEAVNSLNADNLELEEKVVTLESQRNDMEMKLLRAETASQEDKVARDQAEKDSTCLRSQIETLRLSLVETDASREEERAAREITEEECSSLRAQLKEMESILLEKNDCRDQQQDSDAELVARVQELTSEKENLQNEADDLWARMIAISQDTEALNLEIGNLQLANRKIQEELENVQVHCQQEIQGMEDKMGELEKTSAKQHDEDKQTQDVLQREIVELQENLEEFQVRRQQEIIVTDDKIKELEGMLVKEQQENKAKQESLESEVAKLMSLREDSVEDACESDQANEQPDRRIAEYLAQINFLETELKDAKSAKTIVEANIHTTDPAIMNIEAPLEEKDLTIQKLQNQLKASQIEIEDLYSEVEHLKSNAAFLQKEDGSLTALETKSRNDLTNAVQQKDAEIYQLKSKIESLIEHVNSNRSFEENPTEQKLRILEIEKEQMLSVLKEKSRECSNLKTEVHRLVSVVSAEKQALSKLQQDNQELIKQHPPDQKMTKEAVQRLSRLIKDQDIEMEALKQKNQTLLQFIQQSPSGSEFLETIFHEKEELNKQVLTYKSEREQIITILQQKHQESLQYHGEVQRLNGVLLNESQKYEGLQQQYHSVSQSFEDKQKTLFNTQNELVALKARVSELERQCSDLRQKYVQIVEKDPEIIYVQKEEYDSKLADLEKLSSKVKESETLIREKDRLIYDLNREVRQAREETTRKEENVASLQNRLDNSGFQLNEAQRLVEEAGSGSESLRKDFERLQEECTMLKETNRSLSVMVKQAEFEKATMQGKVETMTQILQQQTSESAGMQKILENREALEKQAQYLHQERDQTMLALSQKQAENSQLQAELHKSQERVEKLNKELARLTQHLIEVQDNFTQEALLAEDREKMLRNRLAQAEERESLSSTAIQNASQHANIQVESLQNQLTKLAQERQHALERVSQLEDQVQEREAGTTNLQLALTQIQRDHKRELQEVSRQQQSLLEREREKSRDLVQELAEMQNQLTETSEALDAASRLSEQLDRKEMLIAALKEEVSTRDNNIKKAMDAMKELRLHTEGKVDKQVMKSLVLGYFGSANAQKPEVVRLLARVLDFSQDEMNKVGLKLGRDAGDERPPGWLSWIARSPSKPSVTAVSIADQSFSAQFVQFLQEESKPRPQIRLPIEDITRRPSGPIQIPTRPNVPSTNPALKNFAEHPLLKPISTALPTFTPLPVDDLPLKSNSSSNFLQEVLK